MYINHGKILLINSFKVNGCTNRGSNSASFASLFSRGQLLNEEFTTVGANSFL